MYNTYGSDAAGGAAAAGIFAFLGIIWLVTLAILIVVIAGMWKVFTKAGQPGWAAIVPIYNIYILLLIVGRPVWWLALFLAGIIPGIGPLFVFGVMFVITQDLAKSFGKDMGYGIGLWLLGVVFYPMLGFGSAQYIGPMASGFGLPDTPGGGYGAPGAGGYAPPQQGYGPGPGYQNPAPYTPPAPAYTPPAPTYAPPAPPAPAAPPAAPTYQPPAAPVAPPAAPPAAPTYEPPAAPPAPPTPPAPPA